jgi:hypothetical protein
VIREKRMDMIIISDEHGLKRYNKALLDKLKLIHQRHII